MTVASFLLAWAVVSVVSSLLMGRWLAGQDLIDHFVGPIQLRLDDD